MKKFYNLDENDWVRIPEKGELTYIKTYSTRTKNESSLKEYAIFFPRNGQFIMHEVFEIVGTKQKENGKLGELEFVLKKTKEFESKQVTKELKTLLNSKIKISKGGNYRAYKIRTKKFPAFISEDSLISLYRNQQF